MNVGDVITNNSVGGLDYYTSRKGKPDPLYISTYTKDPECARYGFRCGAFGGGQLYFRGYVMDIASLQTGTATMEGLPMVFLSFGWNTNAGGNINVGYIDPAKLLVDYFVSNGTNPTTSPVQQADNIADEAWFSVYVHGRPTVYKIAPQGRNIIHPNVGGYRTTAQRTWVRKKGDPLTARHITMGIVAGEILSGPQPA